MTAQSEPEDGSWLDWFRERPVLGPRRHGWLIIVCVVAYAVDLATKQLAIHLLQPPTAYSILGGWVKFELYFNSGAAFSMGQRFTVVIACVGLLALVIIAVFVAPRADGRLENIVTGLFLAGIAGNVTDRLFRAPGPFHGHVVDFISLRYFAVFNVADMCITAAATTLVVLLLVTQLRARTARRPAG